MKISVIIFSVSTSSAVCCDIPCDFCAEINFFADLTLLGIQVTENFRVQFFGSWEPPFLGHIQ